VKRILITGFGPFSDFKENPSEKLVIALLDWFQKNSNHKVEIRVLPVEYEAVDQWISEKDFSKFDFIFQFGVASNRQKICLERVALNWTESKVADISGKIKSGQPIDSDQPEAFFSSLNLSRIASELGPQFENRIEVSFTAGAYLCNFVYFKSRIKTENCLFVHIPSQLEINNSLQNYSEAPYAEAILNVSIALIKKVLESN
jgi:pyroglutamyl-peptidase